MSVADHEDAIRFVIGEEGITPYKDYINIGITSVRVTETPKPETPKTRQRTPAGIILLLTLILERKINSA